MKKVEGTGSGSELDAIFCVTDISALAICGTNGPISLETLTNIGAGNNYNKRRKLDKLLKIKDTLSRAIVEDNVTKLLIV